MKVEVILKTWVSHSRGHPEEETFLMEDNGLISFLLLMSCEYQYFIPLYTSANINFNIRLLSPQTAKKYTTNWGRKGKHWKENCLLKSYGVILLNNIQFHEFHWALKIFPKFICRVYIAQTVSDGNLLYLGAKVWLYCLMKVLFVTFINQNFCY